MGSRTTCRSGSNYSTVISTLTGWDGYFHRPAGGTNGGNNVAAIYARLLIVFRISGTDDLDGG